MKVVAGRFELVHHRARGGMSSVWRGLDRKTGEPVAVKLLELWSPSDVERFRRECTLLASVAHPNVVRYIAHGSDGSQHYLTQDWIEGETVAERLRATGLTPREALAMARGVAAAMATMHIRGIIHRDIKPSNIILEGGNPATPQLVDFGIARLTRDNHVLTRTGSLIGTPGYMSPEQTRGHLDVTPACDTWALGCVLYEALTGAPAFTGSPDAIQLKVLLTDPPPLDPDVAGPALVALVSQLLAKDPALRPQSGTALVRQLEALPVPPEGDPRRVPVMARQTWTLDTPTIALVSPSDCDTGVKTITLDRLATIADRHGLTMDVLDDGIVALTGRTNVEPVRAARAIVEEAGVAVAVFTQAPGEILDSAIERGVAMLDRARISAIFDPDGDLDETVCLVIDSNVRDE